MANYYRIVQTAKPENKKEEIHIGLYIKLPFFVTGSSSISFKQLNPRNRREKEEKCQHIFIIDEENKEIFFSVAEKIANGTKKEEGSLIFNKKFDPDNLPKFVEQLKKTILPNPDKLSVQQLRVSNLTLPTSSQQIPIVSFRKVTLVERDIGKAVIAVDFIGCAGPSKRKPVYIAEKDEKLIVDSCPNKAFKDLKNVLLTFYVKNDKVGQLKKILEEEFFGKKIDKIEHALYSPTKETAANLVTRLNPLLTALQSDSRLRNFVYNPNHETARFSYDKETGNLKIPRTTDPKTPQPQRRSLIRSKEHKSDTNLTRLSAASSNHEPVNFDVRRASLQTPQNLLNRLSQFKGFKAIDSIIAKLKMSNNEESLASLMEEANILIKRIKDKKEAAIDALQRLRTWVQKPEQAGLNDNIAQILIELDSAIKRLNKFDSESISFKEFVEACDKLKSKASILKSYFNQKIHSLELNSKYEACQGNVLKSVETTFSTITKKDGGFGTIPEIVEAILTKADFINQFAAYNLQFNKKINELNAYKSNRDEILAVLISAEDPQVKAEVRSMDSVLADWESTLNSFEPISGGTLNDPDPLLGTVIDGHKVLFRESLEKIGMLDKNILEEKKALLVNELKNFQARVNSLIVNSALTSQRENLLCSIKDSFDSIASISNKQGLENFERQYDNLNKRFDLLQKGLTERSALRDFYIGNVFTHLNAISKKSSKLKAEGKGTDIANIKADKLAAIGKQVLQLEDKLDSTDKRDLTSEIRSIKKYINDNYSEITEYRNKYFSGFFFGKLLGQNLENRVESKSLVDALKTQLEGLETRVESLSR